MRALSANMPARRLPGRGKRHSLRQGRQPSRPEGYGDARRVRGAPVAVRQPVFSRLTPRCHVRAASPIPVTAGPPRSQSSGAVFSGECRRKPQNPIRGGPCPLEHPRCSVDVSLRGIRSAAEALSGARRRKPHDPIRGGPCPLERPCCFIVACMEWEARQKERPPRSQRLRGGCCLFYPARNSRRYSRGLQ